MAKSTQKSLPGPDSQIMQAQAALKINQEVKFRYRKGIIFTGLVKERLPTGNIVVKYFSSLAGQGRGETKEKSFEATISPLNCKAA